MFSYHQRNPSSSSLVRDPEGQFDLSITVLPYLRLVWVGSRFPCAGNTAGEVQLEVFHSIWRAVEAPEHQQDSSYAARRDKTLRVSMNESLKRSGPCHDRTLRSSRRVLRSELLLKWDEWSPDYPFHSFNHLSNRPAPTWSNFPRSG